MIYFWFLYSSRWHISMCHWWFTGIGKGATQSLVDLFYIGTILISYWNVLLFNYFRYLTEILNCNFSFTFDIPLSTLKNEYQTRKKFRNTFCRQEACQNIRELERKCKNRKHVVVKTIKTHSLELLKPFMLQGVKVIHLVRMSSLCAKTECENEICTWSLSLLNVTEFPDTSIHNSLTFPSILGPA